MTDILDLSQVTLCAASSVNVAATAAALERCMTKARFGAVLFFTDDICTPLPAGMDRVAIPPLQSSKDYSRFMLRQLAPWIETSHCLVVQWDGFIVNPQLWDVRFLDYDYIGASWPQFTDGYDVGNGGFSLRSRRLLEACLSERFQHEGQAEDLTICRNNRAMLEKEYALRFADRALADRFSAERGSAVSGAFGFHGAFNLIDAVGASAFGGICSELDHRKPLRVDFWPILFKLLRRGAVAQALQFACNGTNEPSKGVARKVRQTTSKPNNTSTVA